MFFSAHTTRERRKTGQRFQIKISEVLRVGRNDKAGYQRGCKRDHTNGVLAYKFDNAFGAASFYGRRSYCILLILIAPSGKNIPPHDDTRQYITFMSDNQYRKETKIARYKGVFLMREILS